MDDEPQSLEYEEDCYYAYISGSGTPSFDHTWPDDLDTSTFCIVDENEASSLETDTCSVETVFQKKPHNVKVTFQDISKPYLARVSSPKNYRRFLQLVKAEEAPTDVSPDSGINELQGLSPEEQEKQKQEWQQELIKVEEEIQTLRHVLASKIKHSQELKRKLGISVWKEFQDDMSQSIKNVKESNIYHNVEEKLGKFSRAVTEAPLYQKTESVIKTTAEKTTSILGGLGSSVTTKIGQLKNSDSFRSLEEKVGSAYENVKTKVATSRSNSTQSFDEALRESEANRRPSNTASTPATTPTIPEEKPLS